MVQVCYSVLNLSIKFKATCLTRVKLGLLSSLFYWTGSAHNPIAFNSREFGMVWESPTLLTPYPHSQYKCRKSRNTVPLKGPCHEKSFQTETVGV